MTTNIQVAAFTTAASAGMGIVRDRTLVPLSSYCSRESNLSSVLHAFYDDWGSGRLDLTTPRDAVFAVSEVVLQAPVRPGAKILCQVVNYREHGAETAIAPPTRPFFFLRPDSSVIGPAQSILMHNHSAAVDFEIELALVITSRGRNIPSSEALRHVGALMVANDVSYRDLQFNKGHEELSVRFGTNWTHGKGLDGSCVLGPWLTLTPEEDVLRPRRIQCSVNGRKRQDALSTSMIFDARRLVSAASMGMTLNPGDVILTGTPAGVGLSNGQYLQIDDVVQSEIEGLGIVRNTVRPAN